MCGLALTRWTLTFIAVLLVAAPVQAGFRITDLGRNATPAAINNNGEVAGYVTLADGHKQAFLFSNRTLQKLGFFGGTDSEAKGLNDRGGMVGAFTLNGEQHGFYLKNGQFTDLFSAAGMTNAVDLNNGGAILGEIGSMDIDAALYENGLLTNLRESAQGPIASRINLRAIALNEAGQAALFQGLCGHWECEVSYRVAGATYASTGLFKATAINDKGVMTGSGIDADPGSFFLHINAFTSDGGERVAIQDLGGRQTYPASINNLGQIVGKAQRPQETDFRAFIYGNGRMIDLNTLVPAHAKTGWTFLEATGINERGQIIGVGNLYGKKRGFLLTPSLQPVQIDIRRDYNRSTTLRPEERVTVTFFGSSVFDAATVRPASIKMAGADMGLKGKGDRYLYQVEDVNNDGFMDFVSSVKIQKVTDSPAPWHLITVEAMTSAGKGIYGEQNLQWTPPVK